MFSFLKNRKQFTGDASFFPITADMHSHILPGIDDGSPDVATSVELVKGLMALGFTKSIATPHIIGDVYRNSPGTILPALQILQDELQKQGIHYEVTAAAEYQLDDYFLQLLRSKTPLLTLHSNYLLTEFSFTNYPQNYRELLFEMLQQGYKPVLAHPERYGYFHKDHSIYHTLADDGFLLQVNLLSLTGYYGKKEMAAAQYLLQNHLVHFTGTDLHHHRHLQHLSSQQNRLLFSKAFNNIPFVNQF